MTEKNRLPVQDLLLVRHKLNDAARKRQLRLIRFLTSKGVYRWGRPVDWTNQIVRAVCEEFGWSEYAEPLMRGAGRQPAEGQISTTAALAKLRASGYQSAECLFANLIDPKYMPRSYQQGSAITEYWSGQLVEMYVRKGLKPQIAIEKVAKKQKRVPVRVAREWQKFRATRF